MPQTPYYIARNASNNAAPLRLDANNNLKTADAANATLAAQSSGNYETVAASQSDQILGATGGVGDWLDHLIIVPGTTAAGAVSIKDGNGSAITVFAGGTGSVADLKPFTVPVGAYCLSTTTPGWKVTTGANVTAIGVGKFT